MIHYGKSMVLRIWNAQWNDNVLAFKIEILVIKNETTH